MRSPLTRKLARRWAAYGAAAGLGGPLGLWVLLEFIAPRTEQIAWVYAYTGLATVTAFAVFGFLAGRLMERIRRSAIFDSLTELYNRHALLDQLPRVVTRAQRGGRPVAIMMIDLDRFKLVNDKHGHLIGDQTLAAVAQALREGVRATDLLGRFGGEEFLVVCPDTDPDRGERLAERLRTAVAALGPEQLGHPGPQTVSIGVAAAVPDADVTSKALVDRADRAMYRAKHLGRNRTVVAPLDDDDDVPPEHAPISLQRDGRSGA